jgi:hypothetical protein
MGYLRFIYNYFTNSFCFYFLKVSPFKLVFPSVCNLESQPVATKHSLSKMGPTQKENLRCYNFSTPPDLNTRLVPVVGPGAELHVAALLVEGEPLHVNLGTVAPIFCKYFCNVVEKTL